MKKKGNSKIQDYCIDNSIFPERLIHFLQKNYKKNIEEIPLLHGGLLYIAHNGVLTDHEIVNFCLKNNIEIDSEFLK